MKRIFTALLALSVSFAATNAFAQWKLASSMTNPKIFSKINPARCSYRLGLASNDPSIGVSRKIYADLGNVWISQEQPGKIYMFESAPLMLVKVMKQLLGNHVGDNDASILLTIGQDPANQSLSIVRVTFREAVTGNTLFETNELQHLRKMFLEANCN